MNVPRAVEVVSEHVDQLGGDVRSKAVEIVDARHGFTVEFSNQPGAHAAEYDEAETLLQGDLLDALNVLLGVAEDVLNGDVVKYLDAEEAEASGSGWTC